LTGVETLDLYHPDVREEVRSRRAEIARLGYDPDGDRPVMHQFRRSDGSSFHADARVTTLPWEGRPAILVAFRDFSEQKKFEADLIAAKERAEAANRALAERERDLERASVELAGLNKSLETRVEERTRELRESQRTLTNLLATTPQGYWHVDNDGRTIDLNPAMCAILCRARDEVLGRTIYDFVVDANKAIFHTELEARKRGKQGVYEIALSRPDGSAISCLNNATPVFDDAGVKTGSIGLWTDVTEMKETERALVRAKEQAQAADVAKSRFLATMSHEIRTPLNGVLGMIGLLGRTRLDDRQRHFVKTVQSSAETLLTVINSILDYSRIEAGAFALDRVDFELPALVGEVVALFANAAAEKRLDLAYFFAPEVPSGVVGDPNRLRQVLVNLVGNAVKFTSQGRVVLRVRRGDAGALRFEVSDTGIGIAPEVRARLFAPFQQADASVTRKYGGTGLGLAISQNIVLTMGGLIEVESALDQGSTFRFDLVLPEATSVPVPRWRVVRQPWHERVLVVDANGSNREIVAGYGESWGLKVETADNGARAIELLRGAAKTGRPFDLAILDMTMTDMDSLDLARRIATEPAVSGVPMIMLTSIDWSVGRDGTREAGIVDVLTKPVNPAQLHDAIANALAKSHPDREVPAPDTPAQGAKLDADVLVAEDNPVNQEIVREYLELLGCRVTVVETGAEAVAAMAARRFDAVFMDCEMPELDGFEATRRARAAERAVDAERVLIVALIANALDGDRERCLAAGMDDYLGKPFSQEQIEVVLFRWIGKLQNAFAEPLDAATVASFAMRPGLFQRAALAYLAQVPNLVKWLREAVQRNSAEGVHFAALSLKSSSANIGANRLAELCARLEAEAKNGNIHGADPIVREIEDEIAAVRRGLESEMSAAALRTTAS
jgi:PAS domain S-box-containing protein